MSFLSRAARYLVLTSLALLVQAPIASGAPTIDRTAGAAKSSSVRAKKVKPLRRGDRDRDGLRDRIERKRYGTSPRSRDTDRDGLTDGVEVLVHRSNPRRKDTDRDGLSDRLEVGRYGTDPRRKDTDRDGRPDGIEVRKDKTDPLLRDTAGDGVADDRKTKRTALRHTGGDAVVAPAPKAEPKATRAPAAKSPAAPNPSWETPKPPAGTAKPPWDTPEPPAGTPKPPWDTPKPPAGTPDPPVDPEPPVEEPTDPNPPAAPTWNVPAAPPAIDSPIYPVLSARVAEPTRILHVVAPESPSALVPEGAQTFSTLTTALASAAGGELIVVHDGTYPAFTDTKARAAKVTIRPAADYAGTEWGWLDPFSLAAGARAPGVDIAGGKFTGASRVALVGLRFTKGVSIGSGSSDLEIVDSEFDVPDGGGVNVGSGSRDVLIAGNRIHTPLSTGVNVAGNAADTATPPVSRLAAVGNHIDGVGRDAFQLKVFDGILIEGNEIERVKRQDLSVHPDVLQTYGGGANLTFRNNFVHDNDAGILVKDGRVTGLVVENNVVTRTEGAAYAMQIFNAPGARIVGNTFWRRSKVALRGTPTETGATVLNNVIETFGVENRALVAHEDNNLIWNGPRYGASTIAGDPRLPGADADDFTPAPDSPLIDAGAAVAPERDARGRARRGAAPDIGAVEAAGL